jgi:hypothetical protein
LKLAVPWQSLLNEAINACKTATGLPPSRLIVSSGFMRAVNDDFIDNHIPMFACSEPIQASYDGELQTVPFRINPSMEVWVAAFEQGG